ncbi:MAG: PAS domain S-box protein [Cyanobacteriota bacterium]|nr:PAS domain S-box protein [Cyanobacteriota bacterium]
MWNRCQQIERQQIQQVTRADAIAIRVAIAKGTKSRILALERMGRRWEYERGTPQTAWQNDATAYLEDYRSLERLQWLDGRGNVRWNLARRNNDVQSFQWGTETRGQLQQMLEKARTSQKVQLSSVIDLSSRENQHQFWVGIPLFPGGQFDGFLLNTFSSERLLDLLLTEVGFKQSKYKIAIYDNAQLIYQFVPNTAKAILGDLKSNSPEWTQRSRLDLYGNQWQLEVIPTPIWLSQLHSYLSETALVVGFVTAVILIALTYFAQSKVASNQELERRVRERTAALWESEQRFRAILENTASIVYLKDRQGRYLLVNRQFLEIFNLCESDILGKRDRDLFPSPIAESFVANDGRALETGKVLKIEEEAQLPSGERRSYISIKAPLCDESGSSYAICGISTDITEQKQVETQLRESQELLSLFIKHVPNAIAMFDTQMCYLAVSQRWLSDYNLTGQNILGRSHYEVFPKIPQRWKKAHRQVLEGDVIKSEEDSFVRADGTTEWLRYEVRPWHKYTGEIGGLIMFTEVITARKQVELELRESEERFRTFADNAPVLIWMSAVNKERTYVNQPWLRFTGRTLDQELSNGWLESIHPEDAKFCWETYVTCFEARFPFEIEYRLQRYDGKYGWILETAIPRFNGNGEFIGYIGSCISIAERKQAQLQLERLNQTLEQRVRERTLQLQESEAKFRNLVDSSQDLVWSVDNGGRFTFVNPAVRQIYGYEPKELLGRSFNELILPQQRDRDSEIFGRLMSGEISTLFQYETAHRAKDGRAIALLFNAIPVCDESGTIVGTTGTATDITERKQAEERLRILERAIDASKSGILVTDPNAPDNPIVYVNSGFEQLTGYSEAEVVGRNCRFLRGDSDEQKGLSELREAIANGRDCCAVLQNYRKDGSPFWNQLSISPVLDREGKVSHFVGVQVDISDRLAIEEDLRRNEALLLAINQVLPLGLYVADYQRDRILFYNKQFRRLWQIEGRKKENLSHREVIERCEAQMRSDGEGKFATCELISTVEDEIQLKDSRILRRLHVPVQHRDRQFGHLSVFEDISDRKRAETELKQLNQQLLDSNAELECARTNAEAANRSKSDFLAKMTHELRTPMNAILGFAQILLRDSHLTETQHQQLTIIASSGEHLLGLINDILDMSKIEAGRIDLNPTNFDLYNLLNTLEQMLQLKAYAKGLDFKFIIDPDVPQQIRCDRQKLHQILINLLGNAIKFTETGSVTLWVSLEGSERERIANDQGLITNDQGLITNDQGLMTNDQGLINFEVKDTGRGIAPEELECLFEAFTQSEAGRIAQEEGTGLGLTISKHFIELMGGQIHIESVVGSGTTACCSVPIELGSLDIASPTLPQKCIVGLASEQAEFRILVVEDRWENRQLLSQLLSPLGFSLLEATNGREGIEMWEKHKPQLILMDLRMPVMNGYAAIQQIKATLQGQATPIIALTASAFDEERQLVLAAGCDDYLRKPFQAQALLEKIAHYTGVQYIYETCQEPQPCRASATSRDDALEAMPEGWHEELHEAATACNSKAVLQLLAAIPEDYSAFKQELTALATDYRFNAIAAMTKG